MEGNSVRTIHHFQWAARECVQMCVEKHICVCSGTCASKGVHSLKLPLSAICDSQSLSQHPDLRSVSAPRQLDFHTSLAGKGGVGRGGECVFSSRLVWHEYFKQATWVLSAPQHKKTSEWTGAPVLGLWLFLHHLINATEKGSGFWITVWVLF